MTLTAPALDHLVVAARTLDEGVAWLEDRLGVGLSSGGEHPLFGTHNALLNLGNAAYLEVLAVNPQASAPARPRWFGLDQPQLQARLKLGPALIHWVARVPQLRPEWTARHGEALHVTRGQLSWTLTVPEDGALPVDGLLPSLIVWDGAHPTARLPEVGVRLERLVLSHPDLEDLGGALGETGLGDAVQLQRGAPRLQALLMTPGGPVAL